MKQINCTDVLTWGSDKYGQLGHGSFICDKSKRQNQQSIHR